MKLKAKLNADITGVQIKRNKSHDGREAFVDLDIQVDQDGAEKRWGGEFAKLAFSTLDVRENSEDGEKGYSFLQDTIKPKAGSLVFEQHRVSLEDEVITAQPELLSIATVDGAPRVIARLRIPVDVGREKLLSKLSSKVGQTVKVEFDPAQASFEFHKAKADKAAVGKKQDNLPSAEA